MNSKKLFFILMALWFLIITVFVAYKEISSGAVNTVLLRIMPVDLSAVADGGDIELTFDISKINFSQKLYGSRLPQESETVYVKLTQSGRYLIGSDIYRVRPESGVFIRGKIKILKRLLGFRDSDISIIYGIESIAVADEDRQALIEAIESASASVEVDIDAVGKARIENLYADGKKINFNAK